MKPLKLDYIDAIRGLAILAVVFVHTSKYGSLELPEIISRVANQGARGVQLFYLASAFTLFLSFKNRIGYEKSPIRNFFIRRYFRIAPIYYIGIIYYLWQDGFGARYWLGDQTHISILNIISNVSFTHGLNPYWINSIVPGGWSIGVEMLFYAILPFLFYKIKNLNSAFNLFLLSLAIRFILQLICQKISPISHDILWDEFQSLYFPNQFPVFVLGIILYFVLVERASLREISSKSILIFAGLFILQLAIKTPILIANHVLFGIGFLIMSYSLSQFKFGLIVNPIVTHIGKISFSMYISHIAILFWFHQYDFVDYTNNSILNFGIRFVLVLTSSIIVSTILYQFVELPSQKIGKRLISKLESELNKTN